MNHSPRVARRRGSRGGAALAALACVLVTTLAMAAPGADHPGFERHTDRPGADYADFDVKNGARECQKRCRAEARCRAWTFVGDHAPEGPGHCWLKDAVPPPRPMENAVSGVFLRLAVDHWAKPRVVLSDLDWVDRIVRVGDVDNFGFGWPADYNPFTGRSTPAHDYPFAPAADDPAGTDRIMVGSGYVYDGNPPPGADGYTKTTARPANSPRPIVIELPAAGPAVKQVLLQLFVDDFQAPVIGSYFHVTLDGQRMPGMERAINALEQTGPIGKLISLPLLPAYHRMLEDNRLEIRIDDPGTGAGDGYAIDFVRVLINPDAFPYSAHLTGRVTHAGTGEPIAGVLVSSALGQTRTDAQGRYELAGLPAGLAVVRARKDGFQPAARTIDLIAGQGGRVDFRLKPAGNGVAALQRELEKTGRIRIPGIYFDVASARLREESVHALEQVLTLMKRHPAARYRIEGHTDSQGAADYNQRLSVERADSVVDWLVGHGIDADRLVARGYGETRPVANNATAAGRALNRRVEIVLLPSDG